jgi:cullin 4
MGDHMFTDLALSADQMDEFNKKYTTASKLSVMVLQRSVWPFGVRNKAIDLPPSVSPRHATQEHIYLFTTDAS